MELSFSVFPLGAFKPALFGQFCDVTSSPVQYILRVPFEHTRGRYSLALVPFESWSAIQYSSLRPS